MPANLPMIYTQLDIVVLAGEDHIYKFRYGVGLRFRLVSLVSLVRCYYLFYSYPYYSLLPLYNYTQCQLVISGIDSDLELGTLGTLVSIETSKFQQLYLLRQKYRKVSLTLVVPTMEKSCLNRQRSKLDQEVEACASSCSPLYNASLSNTNSEATKVISITDFFYDDPTMPYFATRP